MAEDAKRDKVRVRIHTSVGYRVEGDIVILEGYRGRLSDVLNDGRTFLPVSNAEVFDEKGDPLSHHAFVSLHKSAASLIIPID